MDTEPTITTPTVPPTATPTAKEKGGPKSDTASSASAGDNETPDTSEKEKAEKADQVETKEPEPSFQLLSNPARVLPQQVGRYLA